MTKIITPQALWQLERMDNFFTANIYRTSTFIICQVGQKEDACFLCLAHIHTLFFFTFTISKTKISTLQYLLLYISKKKKSEKIWRRAQNVSCEAVESVSSRQVAAACLRNNPVSIKMIIIIIIIIGVHS